MDAPITEPTADGTVLPTPQEEATGQPNPSGPYYSRKSCRVCAKDLYVLNGVDPLCIACGGTVG